MKGLWTIIILLAIAGLAYSVGHSLYSHGEAPQAVDVEKDPPPSVAVVTVEPEPGAVREAVESTVAAVDPQPLPWDPSVLVVDPRWRIPTDPKQNMHWHLNNSALMRGEMIPPGYGLKLTEVARDVRINPKQVVLTDAEAEELEQLLAEDHEVLAEMGKEEWRLKGIAFHEAVERGDVVLAGDVNTASRVGLSNEEGAKRLQPVVDQEALLRQRFGEPFKDYVTTVVSGPPPNLNKTYIVFVPRARAEQSFRIYDEVIKVKKHALDRARDFIAGLPPR